MFSRENGNAKGKTEVRSIRIPKDIGKIIEDEARDREISVNALVSVILKKFADFDRYSDKFEYITLPKEAFHLIIQELDDESVARIGTQVGQTVPKEVAQFWFKTLDINAFLFFLSNVVKHSNLTQYDIKLVGGTYAVTLHHDLGMQWSKFLRYCFEGAVNTILNTSATFELSKNTVLFRFTPPVSESQRHR